MKTIRSKFGYAWVLLTSVFALHIIDEVIFDFLPFYNSIVSNAKENYLFFPFPTFTFRTWLFGLAVITIILFLLSKKAFQTKHWIVYFSLFYGIVMFFNGILHIMASFYFNKIIGGVYSSPFLIIGSIFLLWYVIKLLNIYRPRSSQQ